MGTISDSLAIAFQHHQCGRLQAAEQIYRQILQADPNQPHAIHLLGVIASQSGNHEIAIENIAHAIRLQGNVAGFHNNLGAAYFALRRIPEAEACYRRALELQPDFTEAHYNLGNACQAEGKVNEAAASFQRALELNPDHENARTNLWIASGIVVNGVPKTQGLIPDSIGDLDQVAAIPAPHVSASNGIAGQPSSASEAISSPFLGSARTEAKTKYRICLFAPQGWAHYRCYREVALLLKHSFASLGFDCDLTLNDMTKDRVNILLGYHNVSDTGRFKDFQYIPYQLEQLSQDAKYYSDRSKELLANAFDVWDYASENITFLRGLGILGKYLPIGYHEKLEVIPRDRDKDVDILFYGALSDRRRAFFRRILETTDMKLRVLFGVYGPERDEWIARARVIINVHQFPQLQILESPRVAYLLNNQCFFLCENASNNPYATVGLEFGELGDILDKCHKFIASPNRAKELALEWFRQFKTDYKMVDLLKNVL